MLEYLFLLVIFPVFTELAPSPLLDALVTESNSDLLFTNIYFSWKTKPSDEQTERTVQHI